jgi:multicomponent K+:H+ antiporter subunit D
VSSWTDHLMIVPVALPLAGAAIMLLLGEHRRTLKAAISLASILTLLGVAVLLLHFADTPGAGGDRRVGATPV